MRIIKSSLYKFLLSKVKELDYVQLWGSFLEIFGYITSINNQINSVTTLAAPPPFLQRPCACAVRIGWR